MLPLIWPVVSTLLTFTEEYRTQTEKNNPFLKNSLSEDECWGKPCAGRDNSNLFKSFRPFLILAFLRVAPWQQRWVIIITWVCDPVGQLLFAQHLPGGGHQAGVVIRVVLRQRPRGEEQRDAVPVWSGGHKRGPALALALVYGVWEWLALALGEQHNAEDGEDGEGGKDDLVQEVAAVVLQLHQRRGGHADTACGKHQAEASAAGRGRVRERSKWTAGSIWWGKDEIIKNRLTEEPSASPHWQRRRWAWRGPARRANPPQRAPAPSHLAGLSHTHTHTQTEFRLQMCQF